MGQHHLIRNLCLPTGLFIAGAGAVLALAGPASAASSASPVPSVQTPTAAPSSALTSQVPSPVPSATAPAVPLPSASDPGSISVPAGKALIGKGDSGTPWAPLALLGGGVVLIGAGGAVAASRR
jgi:hypothetical protein